MLGFDLIKVQISQRFVASKNREALENLTLGYGGISSWAHDIKKSTRWTRSSEFQRHHVEDEVAYNARRAHDSMKDIADCVSGLGEHLAGVVEIMEKSSQNEISSARRSYILSIIGIMIIAVGFAFQMVGTIPC